MQLLLAVLIVAAGPPAPIDRAADAVEVFHCAFGESTDRDFDGWPDGWTRRRSSAFPRYISAKISDDRSPADTRSLKIMLNGGAAAIYSPPIAVKPTFSYLLKGHLKTQGLKHDRAFYSITFYDAAGKAVGRVDAAAAGDSAEWRQVLLGPIIPPAETVKTAVISLHLEPRGGKPAAVDLKGSAWFADVWLGRLPRMSLQIDQPAQVFAIPGALEIQCALSGISEAKPSILFELLDMDGRIADRQEQLLEVRPINGAAQTTNAAPADDPDNSPCFTAVASWKPKIAAPGYYQVRAVLVGAAGPIMDRQTSLAVIERQTAAAKGEFGWSLPGGDDCLPLSTLSQLLPQVGIHWVKFPVWCGEKEGSRLDQLVAFAERLSSQGVETVGLLCEPPAEVRPQFGDLPALQAADVFSTEPELWYPSLEPVMTRLALQVRWWQLGRDDDGSFVGYPDLIEKLTTVKKHLRRFGQEVHLGIGWQIFSESPAGANLPWECLSLSSNPPLTDQELAVYLPGLASAGRKRWVSIEPLGKADYSLETRTGDLVRRMLAAKMHGAEGIFIPRPFNAEHGLMHPDGTPAELLLPWRTTAVALSGAEYLGSVTLPLGSPNHLFKNDAGVVMVLWNDRPVQERFYLGEDVRRRDVWGRSSKLEKVDLQHVLQVGPTPTFVTGLSEPVARWNIGSTVETTQIPSVFGVPHANHFKIKNFFDQGAGGQLRLIAPEGWKVNPNVVRFKLAAGEELSEPFTITLPLDASSDAQTIRMEFDVNADQRYQFSVQRRMGVGNGEVSLEVTSRLNERGELEVEQHVTNRGSEPVSFKCLLFAPNRRRMVNQVIGLEHGRETKTYRLENGKDLVGQTLLLRAEEIGGERTLNQRFIAAE